MISSLTLTGVRGTDRGACRLLKRYQLRSHFYWVSQFNLRGRTIFSLVEILPPSNVVIVSRNLTSMLSACSLFIRVYCNIDFPQVNSFLHCFWCHRLVLPQHIWFFKPAPELPRSQWREKGR